MIPRTVPRMLGAQYRDVLRPLDEAFVAHQAAHVGHPCVRGCDACCHGPFDVGPADVWTLVEGLSELPTEPRKRALKRLADTANAQRTALGISQLASPAVEDVGEEAFDAMCESAADAPCPFLEDSACLVYDHRPQPCRLTGATWGEQAVELDMSCPIDLTDGIPRIAKNLDEVEDAIARLELRIEVPTIGSGRTSIAMGVDAVLRLARGG